VGQLVNRYDPKYPAGCPSCTEESETQEHMLRCPCTKRADWRIKFLTAITKILEDYHTSHQLQELMMEGFRYNIGLQETMNTNIPPNMATIAAAQEAIGWTHMMKGRLATAWKTHQQETMNGKETKHKNAQTWSTAITHTILQHWLDLWNIRNTDRHGRDWQSKQVAAKAQVLREIKQLYEYKGMIMPHQEWIFHTTLEQQQQKTAYVLRAFVNNYKPVILESYQTRLETG
jgi:hypothetical protein